MNRYSLETKIDDLDFSPGLQTIPNSLKRTNKTTLKEVYDEFIIGSKKWPGVGSIKYPFIVNWFNKCVDIPDNYEKGETMPTNGILYDCSSYIPIGKVTGIELTTSPNEAPSASFTATLDSKSYNELGRKLLDPDYFHLSFDFNTKQDNLKIKKVIFNPPATIVIWKDGSKTVVKCTEGDQFNKWAGLSLCIAKKCLGSDFHKTFRNLCDKEEE